MQHPVGVARRMLLRARSSRDEPADELNVSWDVLITKNGNAFEVPTGASAIVEIGQGWYVLDLAETDCDTPGPLQLVAGGPNILTYEPPPLYIVDPLTWPLAPHNATIDAIYADTQVLLETDGSGTSLEDIKAVVVEALSDDLYAEPGQEDLPTPTTLAFILTWLYKLARNKVEQFPNLTKVYNNSGSMVDQKAVTNFDETVFTREEFTIGP